MIGSNDSMIKDIQELLSIKSISGKAEGEYPYGKGVHDALEYVLNLCDKFGFRTKRCGNFLGYAEIGEGEKLMGILAHLDVVPAGTGWNTEPFSGVVKDGKLFGRGAIDDKGPAVTVIYAMKDLLDRGVKLNKRVRLIFGCTEEIGEWTDMEYYKEHEELPDFGFTPDADFPLIYAEKGIAIVELTMPLEKSGVESISGGEASNMVPPTCEVTLKDNKGEKIVISKTGVSAHGSTPELGINAISLAMEEIVSQNTSCPLAEFYMDVLGKTTKGELLNCYLKDEKSGEISINPGLIKIIDKNISLELDIRYPVSFTEEDVINRIKGRVSPYGVDAKVVGGEPSVFLDKDSDFIKNLLDAYQTTTGDFESKPMVMGGGTYARAMDNIVAFGPNFPGKECTEHQPNEYALVEDLYRAREIYSIAIERA